jgi:hypothetical protein
MQQMISAKKGAAGKTCGFSADSSLADRPNFSTLPARPSSKSERWLLLFFLCSLPFLNPWVRGDGVGYYAYVGAPLIEHSLDFAL